MNNSMILFPLVGLGICTLGLMLGGNLNQIQTGNASRLQSACLIGMGLSFGAFGLVTLGISALGSWVLWLFMIVGISFVAVGILGYVKASRK